MKKERKYFWCAGTVCGFEKHPISEIAQELKGETLCKQCYEWGARLMIGVVVKYRQVNTNQEKSVENISKVNMGILPKDPIYELNHTDGESPKQ